jgi:hypothetical protein
MDKYAREKRRNGLCEEFDCHNKATHWYKFAYGKRHYVCERHFRKIDKLYDEIARHCGFRYDRGVLLPQENKRKGGEENAGSMGQSG